jgi:hypothetical protein
MGAVHERRQDLASRSDEEIVRARRPAWSVVLHDGNLVRRIAPAPRCTHRQAGISHSGQNDCGRKRRRRRVWSVVPIVGRRPNLDTLADTPVTRSWGESRPCAASGSCLSECCDLWRAGSASDIRRRAVLHDGSRSEVDRRCQRGRVDHATASCG